MVTHAHWHGVCSQTLHVMNAHSGIQPPRHPLWQASLRCQATCEEDLSACPCRYDLKSFEATLSIQEQGGCLLSGDKGALQFTCQDNDCIIVTSDAAADAFIKP